MLLKGACAAAGEREAQTVVERLAQALHSGDLSHRRQVCDVDFIAALGMAARRHRQGASLLHLDLSLSERAARAAQKATLEITRKVCQRRGWPLNPQRMAGIAREALHHYLRPACPHCHGRGILGLEAALAEAGASPARIKPGGKPGPQPPATGQASREGQQAGPGAKARPQRLGQNSGQNSGKNSGQNLGPGQKPPSKLQNPATLRPCPHCQSSGRQPLPEKNRREIGAVLQVMEALRHEAGNEVRKRMHWRGEVG